MFESGVRALWLLASLGAAAAAVQAQTAPVAPPAAESPEYRIGPGDTLRITVYQNPDLTLEARVTESGVISYPLLGLVRLGGRSVTMAEKLIADGLRNGNFVRQPQVTISLLQVRGHQANVLGQVNRAGRFPLEQADARLTDLLALAGGVSPTGADTVVVTGTRNGQPVRLEIDLPMLFAPTGAEKDILIQNGDVIWVERQPQAYIYGEVQRPGAMRVERGMTVLQALATGGGLSQRGTEKGIRLHRRGPGGKVQVLQPGMDDRIQEGDVVYVRESLF